MKTSHQSLFAIMLILKPQEDPEKGTQINTGRQKNNGMTDSCMQTKKQDDMQDKNQRLHSPCFAAYTHFVALEIVYINNDENIM